MKNRDLVNLLNRAAAAIETPNDLERFEVDMLLEDLTAEADAQRRADHTRQSVKFVMDGVFAAMRKRP